YEVVTVTYPSDWWQAFKERWFPMWARKKWPVKYTEEKMQANAYHPDLAIPDHQTFVSILHQTRMNCYK
ncbi:hypothetical protein, partial [Streptococcus pneumoniae]|uniref:hypothetical protein n=1 Tax=Streptococcus pneumoniae TaxID=1313 RepID=UPI001E3DFA40